MSSSIKGNRLRRDLGQRVIGNSQVPERRGESELGSSPSNEDQRKSSVASPAAAAAAIAKKALGVRDSPSASPGSQEDCRRKRHQFEQLINKIYDSFKHDGEQELRENSFLELPGELSILAVRSEDELLRFFQADPEEKRQRQEYWNSEDGPCDELPPDPLDDETFLSLREEVCVKSSHHDLAEQSLLRCEIPIEVLERDAEDIHSTDEDQDFEAEDELFKAVFKALSDRRSQTQAHGESSDEIENTDDHKTLNGEESQRVNLREIGQTFASLNLGKEPDKVGTCSPESPDCSKCGQVLPLGPLSSTAIGDYGAELSLDFGKLSVDHFPLVHAIVAPTDTADVCSGNETTSSTSASSRSEASHDSSSHDASLKERRNSTPQVASKEGSEMPSSESENSTQKTSTQRKLSSRIPETSIQRRLWELNLF